MVDRFLRKQRLYRTISPDAILHGGDPRGKYQPKFDRHDAPCFQVEPRLEGSMLDVTFTPEHCAIGDDQLRVTWFKHLHFRASKVRRQHCDPRVVYLHGGGSARSERSIKHHANYPGCTGLGRELRVTPGELAPSSASLL